MIPIRLLPIRCSLCESIGAVFRIAVGRKKQTTCAGLAAFLLPVCVDLKKPYVVHNFVKIATYNNDCKQGELELPTRRIKLWIMEVITFKRHHKISNRNGGRRSRRIAAGN
ncbi:hypothetical protein FEI15_06610 [Lacticaseibacillus zeae]|uniref:Uncharacterized protein n=1 Tax=Lacticaseibacillus zeae TaxID=57037 RepID=A0A5R8LR23_LACZE|nr:hypothetical protein FEI15_06610 [Lacticaseibacillus zeae]